MRILKPGGPCPCCGQPIKEGLSAEVIIALSWIQYGLELRMALSEVNKKPMLSQENSDLPPAGWRTWMRKRFGMED